MPESIVRDLFLGELRADLALPYPTLDEDQRELLSMLRDSLGRFAADHIDPEVIDREHKVPEAVLNGLAELGLFGLVIPEEHGGLALSSSQYVRTCEDLYTYDGAVATLSGGHSTIGIKALLLFGTQEQQARYLPRLATGELKAAFALSEPDAGSDAQSLKTTARRDGDTYVLDGNKLWITNGGFADLFTVFARTPDHERADGRPSISCFLVERGMGVVAGPEEDKLGIRGSSTVPLIFEGVRVPAANLVGEPGQGFKIALQVLNAGRTGLAGGCVGASRFLLAETARYTAERRQFGKAIGEFELIQHKLGRMAQQVHALDCMVYLTTGLADRGMDVALEAAACKVLGTEVLWSVVNDAVQCAGGNGFTTDYPYERMLRDARVNMIFEGTNEILRLMIARTGLREPGRRLAAGAAPVESTGHYGRRLSGAEAPDPLAVPAALQTHALALSMGVAELARGSAGLVRAASGAGGASDGGPPLNDRQLALAALADQSIALYGQLAVLSRAVSVVEAVGEQAAEAELLLARGAAGRLARRARESAASLRDNDHEVLLKTAAAVTAAGGLPTTRIP